ncbi:hypothetical protein IWW36_001409 [Coemansia brasiliensis]|uniref:Uncharacterized protein n=1 Tax=Coemansia brasiliensis TaxID=2650707 RepID=A0A9W8M1K5_9FUNG|nr:hypothetical protein IWW36_001409 [Coemansia brasiliensis]
MSKVVSDKCANLKHVELSSNERRLENFSDCTPAIIDLAIALGINAKSLALIGFRIAKRTLLENLVGVRMKSIRVLDLCAFNVEFDTLLAVLKAFTNLQHLRCNCICLGNNYEGKRLIDLLNDMVAAYHPFNTNLAFITAKCLYYIDKSSVAKGALVTALLCRKLKKIIVDKGKMEMYNDAVKMLLEENDLEKHLAPSISFPLFFA